MGPYPHAHKSGDATETILLRTGCRRIVGDLALFRWRSSTFRQLLRNLSIYLGVENFSAGSIVNATTASDRGVASASSANFHGTEELPRKKLDALDRCCADVSYHCEEMLRTGTQVVGSPTGGRACLLAGCAPVRERTDVA